MWFPTVWLFLMLLLTPFFALASSTTAVPKVTPLHSRKTIALTFDDGPYGTSTQEVLSILQKEKIHATFFLVGQNVAEFPQEAQQIVAEGNTIGNHTYTHTLLSKLSTSDALEDISKAESEIASTTGIHTHLFRPPYGILPKDLKRELRKQGYQIKMWNDDPSDWNYATSTSKLIVNRVLAQKKPHTILILHDGRDTHLNYPRDNMLQALPIIIEDLENLGYTFVTL